VRAANLSSPPVQKNGEHSKSPYLSRTGALISDHVDAAPPWCSESGTVRAFMYGHSLPPEWWVVRFDERGRVTCTVYLQSP